MPLTNIKCRESVPGQGIAKLKCSEQRRFTVLKFESCSLYRHVQVTVQNRVCLPPVYRPRQEVGPTAVWTSRRPRTWTRGLPPHPRTWTPPTSTRTRAPGIYRNIHHLKCLLTWVETMDKGRGIIYLVEKQDKGLVLCYFTLNFTSPVKIHFKLGITYLLQLNSIKT